MSALALTSCLLAATLACAATPRGAAWAPEPGTSWQYQLQGDIDTSVDAEVYIVDGQDVSARVVDELQKNGRHVVCYLSAGTVEDWRPDADAFPEAVIGNPLAEWPGESWLDIRRTDVLEPIMAARMDVCREKGFDAVDPDNVDGYTHDTGFSLTARDQLRHNRMIARLAHERGLGVALKNDLEQVPELVGDFDFAINESCHQMRECAQLRPFLDAGKAVLHVEYHAPTSRFCPETTALGLSSIRKPRDLTAPVEPCP